MNRTIFWITARGLIGRRRFLLLLPLPLLLIGLAVLSKNFDDPYEMGIRTVLVAFGFAMVVSLTALVVGTGVLSPEIDDGTIQHVLAKPLPRREILLAKLLVACVVGVAATAPALLVAGVIIDGVRLGAAFAVGGAVATIAYCAIFVALSLMSRRPVLIGLVYVLVWEGLLARIIPGTGVLSVQQYALTIADHISGTAALTSDVSLPTSIAMSVVFLVGATVLAVDRLRSFSVAGGAQ